MKFLKAVFILLIISLAASAIIYSLTSGTIKATGTDMAGEIAVVALPLFLFLFFIYLISRAVARSVKKKPSGEGGAVS